ncbi:hypothetical protein O181_086511 [Austropuccinia psidii MF-1]|uniref:Uncharacterized protein n=1 Tax=Austropuccinia psidii MF-1 TaxID=1389203 RepID=A0A9Q3FV08_9BASI|nr:hypothetical protein [Austropuccinia psidii MF-1]
MTPFHWPYPAFIGPIGQFPTPPTPKSLSLFLGLWVFSVFQGPMASLATTRALGPTLYIKGGWAIWALYSPQSVGRSAPFGPIPMRPRGEDQQPRSQVGPPEPVFDPNGKKTTLGPKLAINQSMASGNHQRPPDQLQGRISLQFRGRLPFLQGPGVVHIWYNKPLCTIFAQQSNGDTFRTQLPNSKSSPKSITIFEEGLFSYSVWQFPGGYQKTIQGPQPPGPEEVGLSFTHKDYYEGNSQRL